MTDNKQIPKIIHYCWFGGSALPDSALRCIESWKRFCPDYEIKRWDESNYNVNTCPYTAQAYAAGKWAFVSDYARFDILYTHGGVYFDTDVEMIRPIDDILERGPFMGIEQSDEGFFVAPGLGMAAAAGHPVYQKMLSGYQMMNFLNPDGTYNQTTVVKYTTDLLCGFGLKNTKEIQTVEGIHIYPWDYFCPMEYRTGKISCTPNTRTIHHYSATWFSKEDRRCRAVVLFATRIFGTKAGTWIGRIYSLPYRVRKKIQQKGFRGALRVGFKKICNR